MTKAIFWDNDGILIDSEPLYFEATRQALSPAGIVLSEVEFIDISLQRGESVIEHFLLNRVSPSEIAIVRRRRSALYRQLLIDYIRPNPGIVTCLDALRGKVTMGVVTASLREHFDVIHAITGLRPYFDFVLTHEDVTESKPHPQPYLRALEHVGLPPSQCIVVEDSTRGLQSAKAAGLRCLAVPSTLTRGGNFSAADGVFGSFEDLTASLLEWIDPSSR